MATPDSLERMNQVVTVNLGTEDWDEPLAGESDPEEHQRDAHKALSRRTFFSAAGGLSLAASGLLLPAGLEEAVAREGALGGDKGGRRGNNRRGRSKKRTHGDKKDDNKGQDKPRGRDFFEMRKMAIAVHNYRSTPVRLRGWQPKDPPHAGSPWEVPGVWDWKELPARTSTQHFGTEFVSARTRVAVQIGDNRVVYGQNNPAPTLPSAAILTGSWKDTGSVGGEEIQEGTLWVDRYLFSGDIRITRVGDTEEHILYSVDLT